MLMILLFLITAQICGKMRTNGILRYQIISDNGFNDDGEPVRSSDSWSEIIPCSIKAVTNNSKGRYEDGKFNQASYEVLVETIPLDVRRVKLERDGITLGEYPVQGLPTPTTMGRVKIIV